MDYNPFLPEVQANPYPYFAYMRSHAPVYEVPGIGWAISRYDDVVSVIKNPQLFSSAMLFPTLLGELSPRALSSSMVSSDPPVHTRLRKLANRAFTPRRIASLESHIRTVTRQLIDNFAAKKEHDLVAEVTIPLPIIVVAELLGVEPQRYEDFKRWANAVIYATNNMAIPAEERDGLRRNIADFCAYFENAIAMYHKQPGDNLISDLVRAEEENQALTSDEIVSLAILILLAGSETTSHLIAHTVLLFLQNPDELAKVRANPALLPNAIEESLRYESPIQFMFRQITRDTELAGTALPAGMMVLALFASANHDEQKFPDPERFDITRNTEGHIGFGFGVHFCIGSPLARLQARIALEEFLQRFPRFALGSGPVTRVESLTVRGLKTLPLVVN